MAARKVKAFSLVFGFGLLWSFYGFMALAPFVLTRGQVTFMAALTFGDRLLL